MADLQMFNAGLFSLHLKRTSGWEILNLPPMRGAIHYYKRLIETIETTLSKVYRTEGECRNETSSKRYAKGFTDGGCSRFEIFRSNIRYRRTETRIRRLRRDAILYEYKVDSLREMLVKVGIK